MCRKPARQMRQQHGMAGSFLRRAAILPLSFRAWEHQVRDADSSARLEHTLNFLQGKKLLLRRQVTEGEAGRGKIKFSFDEWDRQHIADPGLQVRIFLPRLRQHRLRLVDPAHEGAPGH